MKKKKILIGILTFFILMFSLAKFSQIKAYECGSTFTQTFIRILLWWKEIEPRPECNCFFQEIGEEQWVVTSGFGQFATNTFYKKVTYCCGYYYDDVCNATPQSIRPGTKVIPAVDRHTLDRLNPLKQYSTKATQLSTPGGIISEILSFAFPIAGMILFVILIMAGLKMLTGASNSKNMEEGKQMITTAILGFIILFAAYWIAQLLEIIFGINILSA